MALKAQKELESKIHNEFFKNVYVLTLIHNPTSEFKQVFKNDMFLKNNKAGFQQVIYYLLSILSPDKITEKVPSWPPHNSRLENQFRNEVMKYINELNHIYEDAKIPQIVTSHLISPGGFKFIKFVFKLSQLVLFEQLKRTSDAGVIKGILLPLKPSKCEAITKENLEHFQIITGKINSNTKQIRTDFEQRFEAAKIESQKIVTSQVESTKSIKVKQLQLSSLKENFSRTKHLLNDYEIEQTKQKLKDLNVLKENLEKCGKLNNFLDSGNAQLEHKKSEVSPEISHLIRYEGDALDFSSLLIACNTFIDRRRLEMKPTSTQYLIEETQTFTLLNDQLCVINDKIEETKSALINISENLHEKSENGQLCVIIDKIEETKSALINISENLQEESKKYNTRFDNHLFRKTFQMGNFEENNSDSSNSTVLATPLPPSPISFNNQC